jgi:hypothetical protein
MVFKVLHYCGYYRYYDTFLRFLLILVIKCGFPEQFSFGSRDFWRRKDNKLIFYFFFHVLSNISV